MLTLLTIPDPQDEAEQPADSDPPERASLPAVLAPSGTQRGLVLRISCSCLPPTKEDIRRQTPESTEESAERVREEGEEAQSLDQEEEEAQACFQYQGS